MSSNFPGPKTRAALERGIPLFKNGLRFDAEMERAGKRGFRPVRQIVIDRAQGDFVWDLDGNRYIDFQNGWATNPLGNCHPEILAVVEAANRRYGFHYDHPLRYELAEMLGGHARPGLAAPITRFRHGRVEAAVHLALTHQAALCNHLQFVLPRHEYWRKNAQWPGGEYSIS
jgi:4-aminobutyrate aminotransferase-like enzyme